MNSKEMDFASFEIYEGSDLGAVYSKDKTDFRLWAPSAKSVELIVYKTNDVNGDVSRYMMSKQAGGTWYYSLSGDCHLTYYNYEIYYEDEVFETVDPYAKAVGVNGKCSMVVDLERTNPKHFAEDHGPQLVSYTDAVIYEISIADISGNPDSGIKNKGKYLGLTEEGTVCPSGFATGLDHIKELGVSHVQLMPIYDFGSVDETKSGDEEYNWGYDPVNYFAPEGSYSLDPYHGEVRIKEVKQMIQKFHEAGIGVIMDVVFNHTYNIDDSVFQKTAPDYFYRKYNGEYSNATACGNEIASERYMVKKYILDCLCYWAKEYHLDGFRFDLMGVIDIETMNLVTKELIKINPFIMIYGEGWSAGPSVLPEAMRALKVNCDSMESVSMFSDDMRDNVRGDVFISDKKGFATGKEDYENELKFSIVGAVKHPQVNYQAYYYTGSGAWAASPADTINYVSCHDNLTLWDKIKACCPDESVTTRKRRNKMAAAIVLTSQGVPFMLSGEEFLRSKIDKNTGEIFENSYNLPLEINAMRYQDLVENRDVYEYYRGLIELRKNHSAFRLTTGSAVERFLKFQDVKYKNIVSYCIEGAEERIFVAINGNKESLEVFLPNMDPWNLHVNGSMASNNKIGTIKGSTFVDGLSVTVAIQKK